MVLPAVSDLFRVSVSNLEVVFSFDSRNWLKILNRPRIEYSIVEVQISET